MLKLLGMVPARLLLLPPFLVVVVDVAVLAHPAGVELRVCAVPWLFGPAVLVVAVVAQPLRVVGLVLVSALILLFTAYNKSLHFFSHGHRLPILLLHGGRALWAYRLAFGRLGSRSLTVVEASFYIFLFKLQILLDQHFLII